MSIVRNILSDYFNILEENKIPKFRQSKSLSINFKKTDSDEKLWKLHNKALKNPKLSDVKPKKSLLDLKIELATRIFRNCSFCERRCGVDRTKKTGECGVGESAISSEFLHIGEERVLIPSHTIFFSGCTFHCVFCQNWDISQSFKGMILKPERLVEIIKKRRQQGAINVNWVGGDPTPNLRYILEVLRFCDDDIPQIWNSNVYCSIETMGLLNGIIDLYLTDFKFGNDDCARRLSKIDNYFDITKRNHKIAYENGSVLIRHLVMPNHTDCCSKPILKWISENIPTSAVNVMGQYRPEYHAFEHNDISRQVSSQEVFEIKKYAGDLGLHLI